MMARKIKIETNLRCDWDHKIIEKGKYATQIVEGEAQGLYHGKGCYENALHHMEEIKEGEYGGNQDSGN